jgi:hypothetical protein
MKTKACLAVLLLNVAVAELYAADGDWLLNYPLDTGHRTERRVLDKLAPQPLFSSFTNPPSESHLAYYTNLAGSNVVDSYRYLGLSSWGFHARTFTFTKAMVGESTNKSAVICHIECKDWENEGFILVFRGKLGPVESGKLLQELSGHAIYSMPASLTYKTPDRLSSITVDAADVIIERWTGTSYSCIMRPGIFDSDHEGVIKDFGRLCYDSGEQVKGHTPEIIKVENRK